MGSAAEPRGLSIIVTGGASGIGLGIVEHFAAQPLPHKITAFDINSTSFVQIESELKARYPDASLVFRQCDVSSWESQAQAFKDTFSQFGHVDVVFANAGISRDAVLISKEGAEPEPVKPDLFNIDVNLSGAIYSVKLGIYYLRKNKPTDMNGVSSRGAIICTASNAGIYPFPIAPVYSATKAGVIGLVRSLALPLKQHDIQINALAPAVLETNIAPSKALFKDMILTPISTLTNGAQSWLDDRSRTGEVAEVHGKGFTVRAVSEYVDEDSRLNLEQFWQLGYA